MDGRHMVSLMTQSALYDGMKHGGAETVVIHQRAPPATDAEWFKGPC